MDKTIEYYNQNADMFAQGTRLVDFTVVQERFAKMLPIGSRILDFGCGSDGSAELCKLASVFDGIEVKEMLFQDLDVSGKYEGIWACSSILHLSKKELLPVIRKMCDALKDNGVIYTSFKYGDFEGERNGRYFTEDSFDKFIKVIPELTIEEEWITSDVRPGRGEEKWLNLILRKIQK